MDLNKMSLGAKLVAGLGILEVLLLLIVPWHSVDVFGETFTVKPLEGDGDGCTWVLTNSVNGLAPEDLDKLAEPFWRASPGREDRSHAGLGLALAQRLAELLELRLLHRGPHEHAHRGRLPADGELETRSSLVERPVIDSVLGPIAATAGTDAFNGARAATLVRAADVRDEPAGGAALVQRQQRLAGDKRAEEGDPLPHPARELARGRARDARHTLSGDGDGRSRRSHRLQIEGSRPCVVGEMPLHALRGDSAGHHQFQFPHDVAAGQPYPIDVVRHARHVR